MWTTFPYLSVVYLRLLVLFEPAEGQYCWSVLDTLPKRWVAKGKKSPAA